MQACDIRQQLEEQVDKARTALYDHKDTVGPQSAKLEIQAVLNRSLSQLHAHIAKHRCGSTLW
jgi:hypothetical protein